MPLRSDLPAELTDGLGVESLRPVSGGLIAEVYRGETPTGPVFIKTMRDPQRDFFAGEANGLRALAATRTLPLPEVFRDCPSGVVLRWVEPAPPGAPRPVEAAEQFGRDLAALHNHHAARFGAIDDTAAGYLGTLRMDLTSTQTWAESYLHRRVWPLVQRVVRHERIDPAVLPRVEQLIGRSDEACGPVEPPSLLHGDLWHGNVIDAADGRRWLVDPSAQFGHRELDLAFMRLFGGFEERVFAAYQEVTPLAPGWQDRVALHQLVPLLVNAVMFGHSCQASVSSRLARLGV
ncbi:MAG: fructosamine kinase family protein [Ornithinimicrobium sp.]